LTSFGMHVQMRLLGRAATIAPDITKPAQDGCTKDIASKAS